MWEIYDTLIDGIDENKIVDELICGRHYAYVRSGDWVGISGVRYGDTRPSIFSKNLIGAPLKEVATCIKSWNFLESSIGLAAINANYNNLDIARKNGVSFSDTKRVEDRIFDPFIMYQNMVKGKNVAVYGHFTKLESLIEPVCNLSIIEWEPEDDDFPVTASEYILPQCDYVFLSNSSVIDKTLPRFIEISKNAKQITIVGPGTPLAPCLFDFGIGDLSGFVVKDNEKASRIAARSENVRIYTAGQKVSFKKP